MSEEIISEIEEDLQKERLKKYWKIYGKYIYSLTILIILTVGGWQLYQYNEKRKNIEASNIFLKILEVSKVDTLKAINEIDKIKKLPRGYELLIKFQKFNLLVNNQQISEAVVLLEEIYSDNNIDQNYRDLALILSVMYLNNKDHSLEYIEKILNNNYYSNIAKELKAYVFFENGRIKDSQNILQNLLAEPFLSQISKDRITNILKTFENS
tara:strand:+ start:1240 stop:1872 length:633 start_codon:yes stop_codon:yes gene_type:complete